MRKRTDRATYAGRTAPAPLARPVGQVLESTPSLAGLLGGQYVGISPGGSDEPFRDGDRVEFVQDAIVLENLISKYLFSQAGSRDSTAEAPATTE